MKRNYLLKVEKGNEFRIIDCSAKELETMIHNSKIGGWKFVEIVKKNKNENDLDSYMNKENYLKDLNTREKIEDELYYLRRRLQDKNEELVEQILVLKMSDCERLLRKSK